MKRSVTILVVAVLLVALASCVDHVRRGSAGEPSTEAFPFPVSADAAYV